ncbi:hypothetical protein FRB95_014519 [Tulasnella sp. JGI-2019a]|nr:hypothetical protein FRB95_014519 [Tulasnella sp. JGI-2019a]
MQATGVEIALPSRQNTQLLSRRLILQWYRVLWRIRRLSKPSALKRQQHAPPPILCLPVELIIEIIKGATSFSDHWRTWSTGYYNELRSLARVCRFFAGTIKGAPGLWSILDVSAARTGFCWNTVIQRSQSCPLIVRVFKPDPKLWLTMVHNIHRWKVASITLHSTRLLDASNLERSHAPTLETLHLTYVKESEESTVVLDLFHRDAPKLRELYLYAVALRDWASPILHGLHLLSVSHIDSGSQCNMQMLLGALRECPELEMLQLYSVWFNNSTTENEIPAIDLPRLGTLHLGLLYPDVEVANYLIKSIRANSIEDLILESDTSRDITLLPPFPRECSFFAIAFDACITSGHIIRIAAGATHVNITVGTELTEEGRFFLHHQFRARDILEWAIPRLNDSAHQINLILDLSQDMHLSIPCLSHLGFVTSLSMDDAGQELDTIEMLEALGSPMTLGDQASGWLWPKLKTLTVEMGQGLLAENVLDMLLQRYGRVAPGDVKIEPPTPLEELNLNMSIFSDGSDMDDYTLRRIREFLGDCVFRCYGVVFTGDHTGSGDEGDHRISDEIIGAGRKLWRKIQRRRGFGNGS